VRLSPALPKGECAQVRIEGRSEWGRVVDGGSERNKRLSLNEDLGP